MRHSLILAGALSQALLLGTTAAHAAPTPIVEDANAQQISQLKQQIVAIAKANQTRQDKVFEVYGQINPLVEKLLSLAPKKTESQVKAQVAGGWHNLWCDMLYAPTVDLTQNYQVVSANGYYYNVFRQTIFGQAETTSLLRGQYTDAGDHLNIEFTRNALAQGWLAPGTKLLPYIGQVEANQINSLQVPGPDGVTGELKNAYVDSDLRIITGGDSLGENGLIYVMERADSVLAPY